MRNQRGTADVFLLIVLLGGTLIPAVFAVGPPHWLDTLAGQIILYGGAVTVAVTGWRKARRGIAYIRRGWHILVGLDRRLDRVERHLGIAEPEEA